MEISFLLVDWDNTLVDFDASRQLAEGKCARFFIRRLNLDKGLFDRILEKYRKVSSAYDKAHIYDRELYWNETFDSLGIRLNPEITKEAILYYWDIIAQECEIYEGVIETLSFLKSENVTVSVIGDSDGIPSNKKKRIEMKRELSQYFDSIFVAGEDVQQTKPHPQIFRYALSKLNAEAEQTAMVGDKYFTDLYGAKLVGIRTVWLKPSGHVGEKEREESFRPDFTVTSFPQILNVLSFKSSAAEK